MKSKETNESVIARKEIKSALDSLLQVCRRNHVAFVGFAWGADPPVFIRFGNVNETGPDLTALLLKLEDMVSEKESAGLAFKDPLTEPN